MTADALGSFFIIRGLAEDVRMIVLGDDNLTVVRRKPLLKIFGSISAFEEQLVAYQKGLGFSLKVSVTETAFEAEYLSGRFYPVAGKYRFGYKPGRVLAKIGYTLAQGVKKDDELLSAFKGTLISYRPAASHVPFLRTYVNVVLDQLNKVKETQAFDEYKVWGTSSVDPDDDTWAYFSQLYGLNSKDEEVFKNDLIKSIKDYGLTCIVDNPSLALLIDIDLAL
jgi:hypothetical protein